MGTVFRRGKIEDTRVELSNDTDNDSEVTTGNIT